MFGPEMMTDERVEAAWIQGFVKMREFTAMGPIGAEMLSINDEGLVIEATLSDAMRQPMGLLHGGVSMLLAETGASMHSAWLADLTKAAPVGIEINGTHLSSAREGRVQAVVRLVRKARAFVFHEIDIVHVDTGRLLCKSRVTNYLKPHG